MLLLITTQTFNPAKKVLVSKCVILACGGIQNKEHVCLASSPLRIFLLMKVEIITSILAAKGNSLEKLLQAQRFCQNINRECVSRVSASLIHSVQLNLFLYMNLVLDQFPSK